MRNFKYTNNLKKVQAFHGLNAQRCRIHHPSSVCANTAPPHLSQCFVSSLCTTTAPDHLSQCYIPSLPPALPQPALRPIDVCQHCPASSQSALRPIDVRQHYHASSQPMLRPITAPLHFLSQCHVPLMRASTAPHPQPALAYIAVHHHCPASPPRILKVHYCPTSPCPLLLSLTVLHHLLHHCDSSLPSITLLTASYHYASFPVLCTIIPNHCFSDTVPIMAPHHLLHQFPASTCAPPSSPPSESHITVLPSPPCHCPHQLLHCPSSL